MLINHKYEIYSFCFLFAESNHGNLDTGALLDQIFATHLQSHDAEDLRFVYYLRIRSCRQGLNSG